MAAEAEASKVTTTVRIDKGVKDEAGDVFHDLGMSFNSGIEVYLRAVARKREIPFELSLNSKNRA